MPASPPAVFVPASAGGSPSSPVAAFVPAGAGGSPAAPVAAFVPAGAGGSPDSPVVAFVPPSAAAPLGMMVSGATDPAGANGDFPAAGTANGRPFYQLGIYRLKWTGTAWIVEPETGMIVYFTSADNVATPDLVTTWTEVLGSGDLIIRPRRAAYPVAAFVPAGAGGSPSSPVVAFTPAGAGGSPAAPVSAFTPAGSGSPSSPVVAWQSAASGGAPDHPPIITTPGIPSGAVTDKDGSILTDQDGSVIGDP